MNKVKSKLKSSTFSSVTRISAQKVHDANLNKREYASHFYLKHLVIGCFLYKS